MSVVVFYLQLGQSLQRVPCLQPNQLGQPCPALQRDQQDQDHHEDHEDHPCQRGQQGLGVQQYPEMEGGDVRCAVWRYGLMCASFIELQYKKKK